MSDNGRGWDRRHSEQLRASMSDADIDTLKRRAESDPQSLTIDEVGVLFLVTRDRIRAFEQRGKR
jgi:DNA-directed RNA polymerase sigma subunit (sigma70/sigma32)